MWRTPRSGAFTFTRYTQKEAVKVGNEGAWEELEVVCFGLYMSEKLTQTLPCNCSDRIDTTIGLLKRRVLQCCQYPYQEDAAMYVQTKSERK
jgi:hypothetical protein